MLSIDSILPSITSLSVIAGVTAFHEAGHLLAAKIQGITVQSYNVGYGPKVVSFNDSENTEFALRLLPLGGYVAFPQNLVIDDDGEILSENSDPNLLQNRPPIQRALVISGGVIANIFLTFLLSTGISLSFGLPRPVYNAGIAVTSKTPDSPGDRAGIKVNDIIKKINSYELGTRNNVVNEFISRVRNTPISESIEVELDRRFNDPSVPSKQLKLTVKPELNSQGRASLGIGISRSIREAKIAKATSVLQAAQLGAEETITLTQSVISSLAASLSTGLDGVELGGPISILKAGASVAKTEPTAVLAFASFLSVNLAVLNSLPLPALDGGQLLFVLAEMVTRRKVPYKLQQQLVVLAFSFLLVLAATTIAGDISRINEPMDMVVRTPITQ